MQNREALRLQEQHGDKQCDHPGLEKEFYNGMATGDYVCTTCGKAGWGSDWNRDQSA